jgi:hypothetical protein
MLCGSPLHTLEVSPKIWTFLHEYLEVHLHSKILESKHVWWVLQILEWSWIGV